MSKREHHIIEHQIINVRLKGVSKEEIKSIQDRILYLHKTKIGEELDRLFSEMVPPGVHVTLDNLNINLSNITFLKTADLDQTIVREFKASAKKAVKKAIEEVQKKEAAKGRTTLIPKSIQLSKIALFEHFLTTGYYPSWADPKENLDFQALFEHLISEKPLATTKLVLLLGKQSHVKRRILYQLSKQHLEQIIQITYGGSISKVVRQLNVIQKRYRQQYQTSVIKTEKASVSAIVEYLIEEAQRRMTKSITKQDLERKGSVGGTDRPLTTTGSSPKGLFKAYNSPFSSSESISMGAAKGLLKWDKKGFTQHVIEKLEKKFLRKTSTAKSNKSLLSSDGFLVETIKEERIIDSRTGKLISKRVIDRKKGTIILERHIDFSFVESKSTNKGYLSFKAANLKGKKIDADGNLVNAQGKKIDGSGDLIDSKGRKINPKGQLINAEGEAIDAQGNVISPKEEQKDAIEQSAIDSSSGKSGRLIKEVYKDAKTKKKVDKERLKEIEKTKKKEARTDLDLFEYFLKYGSIPQWAAVTNKVVIQDLYDRLLDERFFGLKRKIQGNLRDPQFLRRLSYQFSKDRIYKLFETSAANLKFIDRSIEEFHLFIKARKTTIKQISKMQLEAIVLQAGLEYFLGIRQQKFIKQTFLLVLIKNLSKNIGWEYKYLLKEVFQSLRRKKQDITLRPELTSALESLFQQMEDQNKKEEQHVKSIKKDKQTAEERINEIKELLNKEDQTLSEQELETLRKERILLSRQLGRLDKQLEEFDEEDAPLIMEQLLDEQDKLEKELAEIDQQLEDESKLTAEQEDTLKNRKTEISRTLKGIDKEFNDLQKLLSGNIKRLLDNRQKLLPSPKSQDIKKLERTERQLRKYQRGIEKSIKQLSGDKQRLHLYIAEIDDALKQDLSGAERRKLIKQKEKLQKDIVKIDDYIAQMRKTSKELDTELKRDPLKEAQKAASSRSKMDFLIFFLEYGSEPWWAEQYKNQSIEEIVIQFSKENPNALRSALQRVGKSPVVVQRLVTQLSDDTLTNLFKTLYSNHFNIINRQIETLEHIYLAQGFVELKAVDVKNFKWSKIVEFFLQGRSASSDNDFVRHILSETAKGFGISLLRLFGFIINLGENFPNKVIGSLGSIAQSLKREPNTKKVEREILRRSVEQRKKSAKKELSTEEKVKLLADVLQHSKITDNAIASGFGSIEKLEDLFLDQMQFNRKIMLQLLGALFQLNDTRSFIAQKMSDDTFWDIVQFVKPQAVVVSMNYFKDIKNLLGNDVFDFAKEELLFYFVKNRGSFEIIEYLKTLINGLGQRTSRKAIAIVGEWKRITQNHKGSFNSSFSASLLALEIELLKNQSQGTDDIQLRANLQQQINDLMKGYNAHSQKILYILSRETLESKGIPEQEVPMDELYNAILKLEAEFEKIEKSLAETPSDLALKRINLQQRLAQIQGQLNILRRKEPSLLRKLRTQIENITTGIDSLNKELEEATKVPRLDEPSEPILELSELGKEALQPAKEQEDQTEYYTSLQREQEELMRKLSLKISDLDPQQWMLDIDNAQRYILQNFSKLSVFELLQRWNAIQLDIDKLTQYINQNKVLSKDEETLDSLFKIERIQTTLYQSIVNKQRRDFVEYLRIFQVARQRLITKIEDTKELHQLEALELEISTLEKQQTQDIDAMLENALNSTLKRLVQAAKDNLPRIFARIRWMRIKNYNKIINDRQEQIQIQKEQQFFKREELEQRQDFLIQDLEVRDDDIPKPLKAPKPQRQAEVKAIPDMLYIRNAGLVVISPYITRLYDVLGYTKDSKFVDDEAQFRAIHLLQYVATGQIQTPENELVLNKILCNYPIAAPIPLTMDFSEKELGVANGLLIGVTKNWAAVANMSPNGLRGSFIVRDATLEEATDRWNMKVTRQVFDILLKSIPWGYTFVKLPWMEKFVSVDWDPMPGNTTAGL
ncbi:MAG: hypothetical protein GY810_06025 [Aureispira sp.]|nr:hypothetical protein [Aureispira sp.]